LVVLIFTTYALAQPQLMDFNSSASIVVSEDEDRPQETKKKQSRFGVKNAGMESFEDLGEKHPADLEDPEVVKSGVEYDPLTGLYFYRTRVGDQDVVTPFSMTESEYLDHSMKESLRHYWNQRVAEETETQKKKKFSLTDIQFGLGKAERVFGPGGVQLKMQGSAELLFGFKINKVQNPMLSERMRNPAPVFDFDEKIQLNVNGKVGDKINFGLNYNTEASFSFDQSKIKLAYEGKEDDIIKSLEAGNVSMPLNSALIRGSSALFGIKTELQFGKLNVAAVLSQQESETKTMSLKNGAQKTPFEVMSSDYDENRHFFLSHYFRDNFEKAMSRLPNMATGIEINRVEVWVTNKRADFTSARNVIGFLDLGETRRIHNPHWVANPTSKYPTNKSNSLYEEIVAIGDGLRDIQKANATLSSLYAGLGITGGEDYEKVESARRLEENEYTVNRQMGFISLRTQLTSDEVLMVAYEYTAGGKVYQVGEFSSDGIDAPKALILKLLKGTAFEPQLPNWDLMMKNVYNLGATQIQPEDFELEIAYQSDSSGVYIPYLPAGKSKNKPLIRILGLDRLDERNRLNPDGNFDYVEGYTILAQTGRMIFPVLEPFGDNLRETIGDDALAKKYVYDELYDMTKIDAEEYSERNKFVIRGRYKASSSNEIRLNAMNVPRGSVSVTAGGVKLTENVDYTVDYNMGTVTILNQAILESGTNIDVSMESQSLFSMKRKTLVGTHLEYAFSKDFSIGGTLMHLSEKPLTNKVSFGEEPISNTIWGLNLSYKKESKTLTNWLNKIPFLNAKAPSSFSISGEFAHLIPGHSKAVGREGFSYLDDFEAATTTINILYPYSWYLASTPRARFSEGELGNDVNYGKNRALLSWYTVDPIFTRTTTTTPKHIKEDKDEQSKHMVREISEQEIFPNREPIPGQTNTLTTLNLSYYPTERGPYNLDVDRINSDGSLKNPTDRWGGMMRKLDVTDFETANVEYIEFWLLDPFIDDKESTGGDLYFNLGEISEDVLKDGKKSFENGNPSNGDASQCDTTTWGVVSQTQMVVNAFDNDPSARKYQDVGLDGLRSEDELLFPTYKTFVEEFKAKIDPIFLDSLTSDPYSPINDPAGDDFHYYRGTDLDERKASVIERYKRYNGMEGNSPVASSSSDYTTSATNIPNMEDINQDNNMNEYEKYFEYRVSIRPQDMVVGRNHITDKLTTVVTLPNEKTAEVSWYQFKIPVRDPESKVGGVNMKSIRFVRMYLTQFEKETHLRFGTLELVRGDWRKYKKDLYDVNVPPITNATSLDMSVVSVEENAGKKPVNYILPPGVVREQDPGQTQIRQQNEQSLAMKVLDLSPGDARAVYKNITYDMRTYKRLQLFLHAEQLIDDATDLKDSELTAFIRLGSDLTENYYEYEIPLKLTPAGTYSLAEESPDRAIVWPAENQMDIPFSVFTNLKKSRNREKRKAGSAITLTKRYSEYDPDNVRNKVTIMGNPSLGDVQSIMIGVRNQSRQIKSGEVWINELRMSGFDEDGGWAALGNASLNLSDFASVNVSGKIETAGFGSIEDNIQARRMDDFSQLNVTTNAELGKFFPEKANVRIPVYYAYGLEETKPKYDPTNTDLLLKESLENLGTGAERDSLNTLAKTVYTTHSFNVTNLKVDIKSKTPMPYDPANFSLSYAYNESNEHNPDVERSVTKDHKGSFTYQYSITPKPWEPFKNIKALKKPAYKLISDFHLFYYPSSISYNINMMRTYSEQQDRNMNNPDINYADAYNPLLSSSKDFLWSRQFDIKYDLSRSIRFSFSNATNAQFDETKFTPVNRELFPTEYQNWKDTVLNSMSTGGRPLSYQQTFTANVSLPFNKIPFLNWITSNAMYTANYTWDRGALTVEDEQAGRTNPSLGNDITSLGTFQWDGRINLEQLYNKSPYLKRANQRFSSRNSRPKPKTQVEKEQKPLVKTEIVKLKKGKSKRLSHRLNTTRVKVFAQRLDSTKYKIRYDIKDRNSVELTAKEDIELVVTVKGKAMDEQPKGFAAVVQGAARFLMMVRNVSFNYSQSSGMSMSGFLPHGSFFGQQDGAPGGAFAFGYQDINFIEKAIEKGWLSQDSTISPIDQTRTSDLSIKANIEPIPGLRIDVGFQRNYASNTQYQYQYEGMPRTFSGSFSMTTIALGTLFEKRGNIDNNYYSKTFEQFKANRSRVKQVLEQKYAGTIYPSFGFMSDGEASSLAGKPFDPVNGTFSENSADVLIPAFLSAYTGTSITQTELIPGFLRMLPNWRISYDGLSKLPIVKKYLKNLNITHAYTCKYSIGAFSSYANFVNIGGDVNTGFVQNVETGLPIPSSQFDISAVSISENFSPLIRVDATLKNSLTFSGEYRCGRMLALNVASMQLVESGNGEMVFGIGYKISNFNAILKIKNKETKVSNDVNLRLDFSKRNTSSLIRKLDDESITQATSGEDSYAVQFSAEYIFSSKLNFRFFYDWQSNKPLVSTSYPTSSHNFGISVKLLLTR
jgi:cell surface protein SprA